MVDLNEIRSLLITDYEADKQNESLEKLKNHERVRILIADADTKTREGLKELLSHQIEYEVIGVNNGREAVEFVKNHQPDVVFIDTNLPDIDGFTATQQIVSMRETPVVMLSTSFDSETMRNAMLAGARFSLSKPFNAEHVMFALHCVADMYLYKREDHQYNTAGTELEANQKSQSIRRVRVK